MISLVQFSFALYLHPLKVFILNDFSKLWFVNFKTYECIRILKIWVVLLLVSLPVCWITFYLIFITTLFTNFSCIYNVKTLVYNTSIMNAVYINNVKQHIESHFFFIFCMYKEILFGFVDYIKKKKKRRNILLKWKYHHINFHVTLRCIKTCLIYSYIYY